MKKIRQMGIFKVKNEKVRYTDISKIPPNYTEKMNKEYNWMAKIYDAFMFVFPLWKKWIKKVIPHIEGEIILEVSFGSGYLMTKYASDKYEIHGIDFNRKMLEITTNKIVSKNIKANLIQGNVENLPYPDNAFDTIINTMAFTGYPDGEKAMRELHRVLKPEGKLLLVDFNFPENKNLFGYLIVKLWEKFGDIIKDIDYLFEKYNFDYKKNSIGGFGSVNFYIANKK